MSDFNIEYIEQNVSRAGHAGRTRRVGVSEWMPLDFGAAANETADATAALASAVPGVPGSVTLTTTASWASDFRVSASSLRDGIVLAKKCPLPGGATVDFRRFRPMLRGIISPDASFPAGAYAGLFIAEPHDTGPGSTGLIYFSGQIKQIGVGAANREAVHREDGSSELSVVGYTVGHEHFTIAGDEVAVATGTRPTNRFTETSDGFTLADFEAGARRVVTTSQNRYDLSAASPDYFYAGILLHSAGVTLTTAICDFSQVEYRLVDRYPEFGA